MSKPEIMSPAGHWPQLHAAVEAGADAVYFGLSHFTARAKVGFTLDELPVAMKTLHRRGVKGFVTFNTLVFDHELDTAAETLAAIAHAGADAVIVQDLGVLALCRELAPDLEVHASTQMSVTDVEGVRLAQRLGAKRVNLARELSVEDIRKIRQATDCELEIFVHGALCVAYSGQCFSSEAWGGRSANRGQCAQACRLSYKMIVDGEEQELVDERYLLSPGDLYALERIPELLPLGISSLKIEGRYKDAEYVALTTAAYRKAVDEAWAGRWKGVSNAERVQLEQVYSRGLGDYFLAGTNHQRVVRGRAPRHRGVLMGQVEKVNPTSIVVKLGEMNAVSRLKLGDGLVFDAAAWRSPDDVEEGGRIYEMKPAGRGLVELQFGNGQVDFERVLKGDLVWRSHDPEVEKQARVFTEAKEPIYRRPLNVKVSAVVGDVLRMDWDGVHVEGPSELERARNQGLTSEVLQDQLSRLGNTPYALGKLEADITGNPFVPVSLLNQMRREAVEKLTARAETVLPTAIHERRVRPAQEWTLKDEPARLHLLVRDPKQLEAAIEARPASITLDYLDLYGLKPSVARVQAAGLHVRVATPRVIKPGEERIVNFLRELGCPLLVRSGGLLNSLQGELTADFSLNVANALTAETVLEMGAKRLTPTHDLNGEQIVQLAKSIDPSKIEVIAYQHLPVFHTEHCVFCRFLSTGTTYKDCGRPCETHALALEDKSGRRHPVIADVGCRNTVFGAEAQEGSSFLGAWMQAGIRDYRLEFVHESPAQLTEVAEIFAKALRGENIDTAKRLRQLGETTQGSLFVAKGYQELPILQ